MRDSTHSGQDRETLIQGYMEGTLSDEESRMLLSMLEQDPSLGRDIIECLRMDMLLQDTVKEKIEQPAEVPGSFVSSLFAGMTGYVRDAVFSLARGAASLRRSIHSMSFWAASAGVHALLLCAALLLVFTIPDQSQDNHLVNMKVKTVQGRDYGHVSKLGMRLNEFSSSDYALEERDPDPEAEEMYEIILPEDIELMHVSEYIREITPVIEIKTDAWTEQIGINEGIATVFKNRNGVRKKRTLLRFGGSQAGESAVFRALKWFARHQSADGSWSLYRYFDECKVQPSCKHPHSYERDNNRYYQAGERNCATGFALLCFLGAGHTHKAGKFRRQVADGLSFLANNQKPDGSFCLIGYQHAIASMALAEAYGMTRDPLLSQPVQKAVSFILSRQNEGGRLGWNYNELSPRNDTSITGWQVLALKSAESAGFDIGNSFKGVMNFLNKVTPPVKGGHSEPMLDGFVKYTYNSAQNTASPGGNLRLTAIGMLARIFIGEDTGGRMLKAHANTEIAKLPSKKKMDFYRLYYATLAMFQMGGEYWKGWNGVMKETLLDTQCRDGCADGSWDPENSAYGSAGGRVFTTALGCLCLEVYYRYLPVSSHR